MKNVFVKLFVILVVITCISCSKEPSSVTFTYMVTSSSLQTVRVASCQNNGIAVVTIPSTVEISSVVDTITSIGSNAFKNCTGLTTVYIPATVASIASNAFYGCSELTSINVSSADTYYCTVNGVLFNKSQTTLVEFPQGISGTYTIPSSTTTISMVAFQDCSKLTSVTIPSSVTSIGTFAFYGCSGLTAIHVNNTNPSTITLGNDAFYVSSTCKLYVPSGSKSLYAAAAQWKNFSNIIEE
ncbi:MAG: cell surface protein [Bacteroidetes bacterium]|nr:cell surface protein [Bacteroidota bacterium]